MASVLGARAPAFLGSRLCGGHAVAPRRALASAKPCIVAAYGDLPRIGGGRKWEHYEVLPNSGRAVRVKMHVKKGDTVQVIAGKDKGKVGTVIKVAPKDGDVTVEGVNVGTKHIKPRAENETGQVKNMEFAIHHSNVMHYSKEKGVRSRIGHKFIDAVNEAGKKKKVRFLKKTGEVID
jgi:large subunit ribosomal protein L24